MFCAVDGLVGGVGERVEMRSWGRGWMIRCCRHGWDFGSGWVSGWHDLRVGCGPSTGNMDNSVPKIKNVIAAQAIGTDSPSPV